MVAVNLPATGAALLILSRLEDQAAAGWPDGYVAPAVRAAAIGATLALDRAATTAEQAREYIGQVRGL